MWSFPGFKSIEKLHKGQYISYPCPIHHQKRRHIKNLKELKIKISNMSYINWHEMPDSFEVVNVYDTFMGSAGS